MLRQARRLSAPLAPSAEQRVKLRSSGVRDDRCGASTAGGHADIWKETKITPPEPSKTYLYVATAIGERQRLRRRAAGSLDPERLGLDLAFPPHPAGALFWSHVTIRMYNDGMDKFVGHHRNWVVDLENEKVYDIA